MLVPRALARYFRGVGDLATDKFVRSCGAVILSLATFHNRLKLVSTRDVPEIWNGWITVAALLAHGAGQCTCGLQSMFVPRSQQKDMQNCALKDTVECDAFVRIFGVCSTLVSVVGFAPLCILSTQPLDDNLYVTVQVALEAVLVYQLLAALHNGYSTRLGLFRHYGKAVGHAACTLLTVLALVTN